MFQRLKTITHRTFVGFMAIWLSGIVFLLCCHQTTVAMDSCPLARLGVHCDKAEKERNAEKVTKQSNDTGMDCCAFIPAFFEKTRTIDGNLQVAASAPTATVVKARLVAIQTNFAPAYTFHSTVLLKNDAFLKNHSLRI